MEIFNKIFVQLRIKHLEFFFYFHIKEMIKWIQYFNPLVLHKRKLRLSKMNKLSQVTEQENSRTIPSYSQSLLSSLYLLLVASVVSDSVRPHRRQPTRLLCPWDSPGKNTGVGCHFLLQCMSVKSESEVAQSYLTLRDPMDCSPPGSSVHGIF